MEQLIAQAKHDKSIYKIESRQYLILDVKTKTDQLLVFRLLLSSCYITYYYYTVTQ